MVTRWNVSHSSHHELDYSMCCEAGATHMEQFLLLKQRRPPPVVAQSLQQHQQQQNWVLVRAGADVNRRNLLSQWISSQQHPYKDWCKIKLTNCYCSWCWCQNFSAIPFFHDLYLIDARSTAETWEVTGVWNEIFWRFFLLLSRSKHVIISIPSWLFE